MTLDIAALTWMVSTLLVGWILAAARPSGIRDDGILGVNVQASQHGDKTIRQVVRSYRIAIVATAVALGVAQLLWRMPWVTLAQLLLALLTYSNARRQVVRVIGEGSSQPQASSRMAKRTPAVRMPWTQALIALVSVGASVVIMASQYSQLPETIPTHWGNGFEPDAWSEKSIASVFALSFVALGLVALMLLISALVVASARSFGADSAGSNGGGRLHNYAMMAATNVGLGWLMATLAASFGMMQVVLYHPEFHGQAPMTMALVLVVSLVGGLGLVGYLATVQNSLEDDLRRTGVRDTRVGSDDGHAYKWGAFYYNPADPSVIVEKRYGIGIDFNYATWQGKAFAAFVLVTLAACLALPFII